MSGTKTIQNLLVLEKNRETAKELLLHKYDEVVNVFIGTIKQVMNFKNVNHFEAMKIIQDTTTLSDAPDKKIIFAAALMEIVEEVNLKPLKK